MFANAPKEIVWLALATVIEPLISAKSLAEVAAFTVKILLRTTGVAAAVGSVSVAVLEKSLLVKETGLGENDAVTPGGSQETGELKALDDQA